MLLLNDNRDREERITLTLHRDEAEELVEKLAYLLQHPDYHHDHLEDYANKAILDLVVIQPDQLQTYDLKLRDQIKSLLSQGEPSE